jgi:hypothetical protein
MIDRIVHHAEVIALKGDSYRLRDRDLRRPPHGRARKAHDVHAVRYPLEIAGDVRAVGGRYDTAHFVVLVARYMEGTLVGRPTGGIAASRKADIRPASVPQYRLPVPRHPIAIRLTAV